MSNPNPNYCHIHKDVFVNFVNTIERYCYKCDKEKKLKKEGVVVSVFAGIDEHQKKGHDKFCLCARCTIKKIRQKTNDKKKKDKNDELKTVVRHGTRRCFIHQGSEIHSFNNRRYCPQCDKEERKKEKQTKNNYRTIIFNNKEIRIEGKRAATQNLQPAVMRNPYCMKCRNQFTMACNHCVIPAKNSRPVLYNEIGREEMRGLQDITIRINTQWLNGRGQKKVQPMADYDPICKVCANRYLIPCNRCLWKGDVGNDAKHSNFKSCAPEETKGVVIEEIKADIQPPFEIAENFSFFKMIKDNKTIFMGMAHKDNIEMLRGVFEAHKATKEDEVDDDMIHIHKDNANIVITKKLAYVNLKNLSEEEKSEIVDKLFHMIGEALSPVADGQPPNLDAVKMEGSDICVMCGMNNTNDDVNLCDTCLNWFEDWYPGGFPME